MTLADAVACVTVWMFVMAALYLAAVQSQPAADTRPKTMARWIARENADAVWRKVKRGQR